MGVIIRRGVRLGAAVMSAVLLLSTMAACSARRQPTEGRKSQDVTTGKTAKPADSAPKGIYGTWVLLKDSGGRVPKEMATVIILFDQHGQVRLTATSPEDDPLKADGQFSVAGETANGGTLKLAIPDLEYQIDGEPYTIAGDTLTLPFQVLSDGKGTSSWAWVPDNEFTAVFRSFDEAIEAGKSAQAAAEAAAQQARAVPGISQVRILSGGAVLEVRFDNAASTEDRGWGDRLLSLFAGTPAHAEDSTKGMVHHLYMNLPEESTPEWTSVAPMPAWADLRDFVDPQNPDPKDAPKNKTALIIEPFLHNTNAIAVNGETWSPTGGGADPKYLSEQLAKAGYEVKPPLLGEKATLGAIYRALKESPGVIYFATHGNVDGDRNFVLTGGYLASTATDLKWKVHDSAETVLRARVKQDAPELFDLTNNGGITVGWVEAHGNPTLEFAFPEVWPLFFEWALHDADLSQSLVFLESCDSATVPALAEAFRAKVFLGYKQHGKNVASEAIAKYFFTMLKHPTRSAREVWDRARDLTADPKPLLPDEKVLFEIDKKYGESLKMTEYLGYLKEAGARLVALDSDFKPYKPVNPMTEWLLRMGRQNKNDVRISARKLEECYAQYWGSHTNVGLKDAFCIQGQVGSIVPTGQEVQDAEGLLIGDPAPPGGRFILR